MHGYILLNTSVFTLHKQYSSKIEDITIEFLVLGIKPINNNFFSQLLKTEFSCTNNFTLQTFIQFKKNAKTSMYYLVPVIRYNTKFLA